MRGHGAFKDWAKDKWEKAKVRFKPFAKNVAKDTLLPIGKDLLLGRAPTADSIAQNLKSSLKRNALKEVREYLPVPVAKKPTIRISRRRTTRRIR